jgi:uncharacterized RDD family membrane protein YckC
MGDSTARPPDRPERREPPRRPTIPERLIGTGARGAQRVAKATGVDEAAETFAEEAIVRAIESEAAERAIARVLQGPVVEEAVEQALTSPAIERALTEALDSEMIDRLWERLLASDEAQKLVERIAEAPEVRAAIASQGVGLIDDLGRETAKTTHRLDRVVERLARGLLRRPKRESETDRAGAVSRGLALVLDAAILNAGFFAVSSIVALLGSLIFNESSAPAIAIGATAWFFAGAAYLVFFWSLAGQTPGMRFLRIRLDSPAGRRIGLGPALRRFAGLVLSFLTFGIGFIGILFSDRRRGWADRLAGTEVVYVGTAPKPAPWSGTAEPQAESA